MNIYQKLKKAGYMTDGLASPLKIDPPKKSLKKAKIEEIPSRRDSAVVARAYQVEKEDAYTYKNTPGDIYKERKFAKERKSDPYAYPKSEYKSTSKKFPKLDKHMSTFDNRSAFIEKHGGSKLSPKPQYDRPAGPRKRPTKKYYDGSKTYPRESKDLYTGPTKVDEITRGLRTSKTGSTKDITGSTKDIKRIKKSNSALKYDGPKKRVKKKSLTPEQKEKMKREEFERRVSHARSMSRTRK
jgi:hypothetical protein